MMAQSAAALLSEIAKLGEDALCRPIGDLQLRQTRVFELTGALELAIEREHLVARFLDNFAPLLLAAVGHATTRRRLADDAAAEKWESIVGALLPHVRADSWAVMAWLKDVSRAEAVTR